MLPQPPPGFERDAHFRTTHGKPVEAAPVRPRLYTSLSVTPPQPHVSTTQVGHILCAQLLHAREVQVPPLRELTTLMVQILEQELVVFPNHEPWFFLWSNLGNPNLTGLVTLIQLTVISCNINTVSVLQWNSGPARRNPTNNIAAACGKFHAVILQEASDHVPHISGQFIAYTDNTDLAISAQQGHL